MNTVDIIIIGLVFFSAIVGFWRGITREILGILSWILASIIAYFLHSVPESFVGLIISNEFLKETVSGLVVFLVSLVVLTSVTYSFSSAVKASVAGGADKFLGFLFGACRGFVLISLLAFGANKFLLKNGEKAPPALVESRLIPIGGIVLTQVIQSIPPSKMNAWKEKIEIFLNDISLKGTHKVSEIVGELPEEGKSQNAK